MERVIKKDDFGDIACNDIIIYSVNQFLIGKNISNSQTNWEVIEQKYYQDREDDSMVEVWYRNKGILLDNGLNKNLQIGRIFSRLTLDKAVEISYEQAMQFLDRKQNKELENNNKSLLSKVEDKLEKENVELYTGYVPSFTEKDLVSKLRGTKKQSIQNNNGGATDYYSLPRNANTLQDLIEHRNMNGSVKDIFKACYRLGIKTEDELRDLNKMAYYSLREIGRITNRRDYITIAEELMGEQAIENQQNKN